MKKALFALATASTLAIGMAGASSPAQAGCGWGCGVGIGVGAFALGAMATAPRGYVWGGYEPAPGYVAYTGYGEPMPVGCPGGYWARRPVYDQWGNQMGWSRPRFFCPY
ncbi:MAG TPA: hypothetical protein VKT73_14680 [Xanthobacteraceae bacterium]|nr:hypothetical protein [Xanthobacteraceae bacterium]